jgi:hypothetical protein
LVRSSPEAENGNTPVGPRCDRAAAITVHVRQSRFVVFKDTFFDQFQRTGLYGIPHNAMAAPVGWLGEPDAPDVTGTGGDICIRECAFRDMHLRSVSKVILRTQHKSAATMHAHFNGMGT